MLPRDTITQTFDNPNNNEVLLSATITPRTILNTSINCLVKSSDIHIMNGINYVYDWENTDVNTVSVPQNIIIPASTTVVYTETGNNQHCSIQIDYVNRDRQTTYDDGIITHGDLLVISSVFLFILSLRLWSFIIRKI